MQYELDKLEKLVMNDLDAFDPALELDPKAYGIVKSSILEETERIKKAFVKKSFTSKKEKQMEFYIHYHQESIINLFDYVVSYLGAYNLEPLHSMPEEYTRIHLYQTVYLSLEQLLAFIERHFSKYFNQDAKSPESYRYIVHREIQEKVPDVRHRLEKKGIDKQLMAIALFPLDEFIEGVHRKEVSYRRLIYYKELLNELYELGDAQLENEKLNLQVCMVLCYLNYNANRFYKYCIQKISQYIQKQRSLSGQMEKLAYLLKLNNQIQVKPGFAYHPKAHTFQEQLSEWITEELHYLEKRQQLLNPYPANADEPVQKNFKLKTDLSVPQLAYFLKLLIETGIIKNKNTLEVIRFTAGIIQTKNTENISWGGLRARFYQPQQHAVETIKDRVISFLNYIRKEQH